MAARANIRDSRSISQELPDDSGSDLDDNPKERGGSSAPGKPGRKKNPDSQQARRDQNRIAQREFRLRKQQRIRDLEARVEILSGTKDETVGELKNILKDLMQENHTLRALVRTLSEFIGEGMGGCLPKLGFDKPQNFIDFLNKAETDTAVEGFQKRKQPLNTKGHDGNGSLTHKRHSERDDDLTTKRPKLDSGMGTLDMAGKERLQNDAYASMLLPMTSLSASQSSGYYPTTSRSPADVSLFGDILQGGSNGSAVYMSNNENSPSYTTPGTSSSSFTTHYNSTLSVNTTIPLSSSSYVPNSGRTASTPPEAAEEQIHIDPKFQEATRLIHYHLDNYKRNNAYCLPQSLRPTLVQRTVPHESIIDGVPHPELRDRLILQRGRFDLVDCLHDFTKSVNLHGDDVLAHSNWEPSESWLRKFHFLVDTSLLNICNRWRRERGELDLSLSDIGAEAAERSPVQ